MPSITVENYIKQIYLRQQVSGTKLVAMGQLASSMNVVPGTATTMVKALAASGLVLYEPRGGVKLTKAGNALALHILRRHRLVELFLVQILKLDWSEVHVEAEELEHAISDKVLDKIDALLGHPQADPHGDPIPSARGKLASDNVKSLSSCKPKQRIRIARVLDQDADFLKFINRCGLKPGSSAVIDSRDPQADSITVKPDRREPVTLGASAAGKVLVTSE